MQEVKPDDGTGEGGGLIAGVLPTREDPFALMVVGLGASAGGIQALQEFFQSTPADTGLAFVVVLHLSPEHESHLAELLGRITAMPVMQVTEPVPVEANRVYVIPPNKNLSMEDGHIQLAEPGPRRGRRVAVDHFFRTLADARGPQAIVAVLSGTGADGTLGLKQIKEVGGLTLAQEPGDAEHDAMPRSAIATGMVDYVLPARDMPAQILAYRETSRRMRLPDEAAPAPSDPDGAETALRDVLAHLRAQTGHDFSHYKRPTVVRRLGRRMQVNGTERIADYLQFLRRHPAEVGELLGDLLISVTQFFRDREAWDALERDTIPRLFENKGPDDQVRVWVCGCATGEEAYSVAVLLCERASGMERPPKLQVFATDIDGDAIAAAREGGYPETIAGDVSPERLRRWFYQEGNGRYQIKKEVREIVLFAAHDVLKDTPFSRLDLVTCRNLLIYLNRSAQERVLDVFHFALRAEGRLFLGSSESVDGAIPLFAPTDKPNRLYVRRPAARPLPPILPPIGRLLNPIPRRPAEALPAPPEMERFPLPVALHRTLLELYAPPSILVNENHGIVHLSERAGRFLRFAGGEPSLDLLRVVQSDLRLDLRTALSAAAQSGQDEVRRVRREGEDRVLRLLVRPLRETEAARGYFLVLFEEETAPVEGTIPDAGRIAEPMACQLEEEITRLQGQIRSTVEQYEASVEELKASNEELKASNEELQAVNEELITVNHELKSRVEEVSRANSDLQNLMAATQIGTLFLDRNLRIARYTPSAAELFNVIPTDTGRPFGHLTHRLDTDDLAEDALRVLDRLTPVEREVRGADGRFFLARLLPYRTPDDRIDGVVLTFVDITRRKQAEEAIRAGAEELRASTEDLRRSEERFRLLVEGARDYAMFLLDTENRVTFWSVGAERVFGWTGAEAVGQPGSFLFTPEDRERGEPECEIHDARTRGRAEDRRWHLRRDGTRFWADGVMTRLDDTAGNLRGFAKIARDATDQRRAEEALQEAHDELRVGAEVQEARVAERTATLTQTLAALETALAERARSEAARQEVLRRLVTAEEEERRRIARELHDHMGQELTALLLGLQQLRADLPAVAREEAEPLLGRLQSIADGLGREAHDLALQLRPAALDSLGLRVALANHVEEWSMRTDIPADFHSSGLDGQPFPPAVAITVYRVVQETLTNVARHAGARHVSVLLERGDSPGHLVAIVEDDGAGFDADATMSAPDASRRLGLMGMRERAALVGGTLEVESSPGNGTTVFLRIPL